MKAFAIAIASAIAITVTPLATVAQSGVAASLDQVRAATAKYNWLPNALADSFAPFSLDGSDTATCFDGVAGGMGDHYVHNVDAVVTADDPEALVYDESDRTLDGQPRLVGVEYVVPQQFVEDESGDPVALPSLFGQAFHKAPELPLYVLHAWIWDANPDGIFADLNPRVAKCPRPYLGGP